MKHLILAVMMSIVLAGILMGITKTQGIPSLVTSKLGNVYLVGGRMPSYGTGVWLDEWHVLTNCHVAAGSIEAFRATSPDHTKIFKLEQIACDRDRDLALMKSWWPNHDAVKLNLKGDPVAFGAALFSAGFGTGAGLGPKKGYSGYSTGEGGADWRITLPISPGDSGSPVFDERGNFVGLVAAGLTTRTFSGFRVPFASIGYAISGATIFTFLREMDFGVPEDELTDGG